MNVFNSGVYELKVHECCYISPLAKLEAHKCKKANIIIYKFLNYISNEYGCHINYKLSLVYLYTINITTTHYIANLNMTRSQIAISQICMRGSIISV